MRLLRTVGPQEGPENSLPLTPLSQALIVVFKEVFPLARSQNEKSPQSLDATGIQLDHAYMRRADLKDVWMPESFLRNVDLIEANLVGADLSWADISHANLSRANLSGCNLSWANLSGANLGEANLSTADLSGIDLSTAYLRGADLSRVNLSWGNLTGANLEGANLSRVNLHRVKLLEVKGLTKEQLEACQAKGAIIDEDPTITASQPIVAPSASLQSNDAQTPLAPSTQGSTPSSDIDGSSIAPSSPQDPKS